jgi:hypothetical protein
LLFLVCYPVVILTVILIPVILIVIPVINLFLVL